MDEKEIALRKQVEELQAEMAGRCVLAEKFARDSALVPANTGMFAGEDEGIAGTFERVQMFSRLRERGYTPEGAAVGVNTIYSGFRRIVPHLKNGILEELIGRDGKATPFAEKIKKAGEASGEQDVLLPFNTYASLRQRELEPAAAAEVVERIANLSKLRKDKKFGRVLRYYGRVLEAKYEIGQAMGVVERAYKEVYGMWFTLQESRMNLLDGLAESEIENVHGVRVFEEMLKKGKKPGAIIKEMGIRKYFKTPIPEIEEPPL